MLGIFCSRKIWLIMIWLAAFLTGVGNRAYFNFSPIPGSNRIIPPFSIPHMRAWQSFFQRYLSPRPPYTPSTGCCGRPWRLGKTYFYKKKDIDHERGHTLMLLYQVWEVTYVCETFVRWRTDHDLPTWLPLYIFQIPAPLPACRSPLSVTNLPFCPMEVIPRNLFFQQFFFAVWRWRRLWPLSLLC